MCERILVAVQIREKRQERFHEARMQRSRAAAVQRDRRELQRDIATVRAPEALLKHKGKEAKEKHKMLIPVEGAKQTEDRMAE